jgi:hypothetical protein
MTPHERRWKKELRRRKIRRGIATSGPRLPKDVRVMLSKGKGVIEIHPGNVPPPKPEPLHNDRIPESGIPKGKYKILPFLKRMFRRKV